MDYVVKCLSTGGPPPKPPLCARSRPSSRRLRTEVRLERRDAILREPQLLAGPGRLGDRRLGVARRRSISARCRCTSSEHTLHGFRNRAVRTHLLGPTTATDSRRSGQVSLGCVA
jgi:hypothetical protein